MVNVPLNHKIPPAQADLLVQNLGVSHQRIGSDAGIVKQLRGIYRLPWSTQKDRDPGDQAQRSGAAYERDTSWSIDSKQAAEPVNQGHRGAFGFHTNEKCAERLGARTRCRKHCSVAEGGEARHAEFKLFAGKSAGPTLINVRAYVVCGRSSELIFQMEQKKVG